MFRREVEGREGVSNKEKRAKVGRKQMGSILTNTRRSQTKKKNAIELVIRTEREKKKKKKKKRKSSFFNLHILYILNSVYKEVSYSFSLFPSSHVRELPTEKINAIQK